jgi:hypothetical protein
VHQVTLGTIVVAVFLTDCVFFEQFCELPRLLSVNSLQDLTLRPENIAELGKALSMELEVEAQERAVGPWRSIHRASRSRKSGVLARLI